MTTVMRVWLGVLLAVAVFAAAAPASAALNPTHVSPLYSRTATEITGTASRVICWGPNGWNEYHLWVRSTYGHGLGSTFGFVLPGDTDINLSPQTCARLDLLAYTRKRPKRGKARREVANAVTVLAHESMHAAGISDEGVAHCFGMQLTREFAREIGVRARYARRLAKTSWRNRWIYPAEYDHPDCYNGGPLDLRPNKRRWP